MARVAIFGATSAIAAAVAERLARRGDQLHLVGRDPQKLAAVAARCTALGAAVTTARADLAALDRATSLCAEAVGALKVMDLALIAHGDLGDQLASERSFSDAERTLKVNLTSVVALLIPLANYFEGRRGGGLAVMTSVAGERGRPRNYTYGTAKGALHVYLQGLRSRLYPAGVAVTTLKLGPVDTPMTRDHPKNALFGTVDTVADAIVAALDARAAEVYVPWYWAAIMPVVRAAPEWLFQRLRFLSGR